MTNIEALCSQLAKHIDNGDLMTALNFFEETVLPYHQKMDSSEHPALFEQISVLAVHVDEEEWNEALIVVDKIAEILNG